MPEHKFNIAFIGLSHLGTITSICFSSLKLKIYALDLNDKLIEDFKNRKLPFFEPGLDRLFQKNAKNITYTNNFSVIKNMDCVFLVQDTATNGSGSVQKLNKLIKEALPYFKKDATIILMSQVPLGFCHELNSLIQKKHSHLNLTLYHWVDTVVMTNAIERILNPERIIIGGLGKNYPLTQALRIILSRFKCPKFYISYESAEVVKAGINFYLATSVTFANTLADICEASGASIQEVIPPLRSDKRIGPLSYINPSLGIAGGHLERDLLMFKRFTDSKQIDNRFIKDIIELNENRYLWVVSNINQKLQNILNPTITIWGISYKKNSASTENAPALKIINSLKTKYKIQAYDPMVTVPKTHKNVKQFHNKYLALRNAHCLVITNDWEEFKKANVDKIKESMKGRLIIDCSNSFESKLEQIDSFDYLAIGRGLKNI